MEAPGQVLGPQSRADALASVPGTPFLLVGCSAFQGQQWTGGIALMEPVHDDVSLELQLQASVGLAAGVPALACLASRDAFTGQATAISGADNGSVGVWSIAVGGEPSIQSVFQATWHDDIVSCIAAEAVPGSTSFASTSWDGTSLLWDCTPTGLRHVAELRPGCGAVHAAAWCGPALVLATEAGGCLLWDPRQGGGPSGGPRPTTLAAPRGAGVTALAPGADGATLYLGDGRGALSAVDLRGLGSGPQPLPSAHREAVRQLLASPDAKHLVSGDTSGQVWETGVGMPHAQRALLSDPVPNGLALTWHGARLAVGGPSLLRLLDLP